MDLFIHKDRRPKSDERRSKPRIHNPFPAKIRGVDENEKEFEIETRLDNLSGNSLGLRIMRPVKAGTRVTVVFSLSSISPDNLPAPHVKVHGNIIRVEQKPGGVYGLVVAFTRPQFV
jgi:hypothetical protein